MKKKQTMSAWIVSAVALMVVAGASPARADETMVTKVPFDFIVGRAHLPAGDYIVTENLDSGFVSVMSKDGEHNAVVLTNRAEFDEAAPQAELVFQRFGGQLFLSRIVSEGHDGREILLTPEIMERELQHVAVALKP